MKKAEIECITKAEGNAHEITHIGGTTSNRTRWKQSIEKTIKEIENEEWEYFVLKEGQHLKLIVGTDNNGTKHIKTEGQGSESNFLLTLPLCP